MQSIPVLSTDLIKELDLIYPDKCPSITAADRKIWFDAGARSVISMLKNTLASQDSENENHDMDSPIIVREV